MKKASRNHSPSNRVIAPGVTAYADGRRLNAVRSKKDDNSQVGELSVISDLSPFGSVWSFVPSQGDAPAQCSGQAVVYHQNTHSIYTAYGRNPDDSFSSQFWRFSLITNTWERIKVKEATPRAGCGSVVVENRLWFFGGVTPTTTVRNLHYFDLTTHELIFPETKGPAPPPCTNPLIITYNNLILIWAGTTGPNPSPYYTLNLDTLEWTCYPTDYVCRQGACGNVIGSTLYIFGASCPMTLLALDLNTLRFTLVKTSGVEPPIALEDLSTVAIETYFLAFETVGNGSKTRLFVYDTIRSNWMCFSVMLTEEANEGNTPKVVFYLEEEKRLIAVWESVDLTKQPITELFVTGPMAKLNLTLDMLISLHTKF